MNFAQKAGFTIVGFIIGGALLWFLSPSANPKIRVNNPTTTIMPGAVDGNTTVQLDAGGNSVEVFFDANLGMGSNAAPMLHIAGDEAPSDIAPGHGYIIKSAASQKSVTLTVYYNNPARFTSLGSVLDFDQLFAANRPAVYTGVFTRVNVTGNPDYASLIIGDSWKLLNPNR